MRSKRPGRRRAGSSKSLRLVAPRNITPFPLSNPSSSINSWLSVVSLSCVAALYGWSLDSLKIPWRLLKNQTINYLRDQNIIDGETCQRVSYIENISSFIIIFKRTDCGRSIPWSQSGSLRKHTVSKQCNFLKIIKDW